MTRQRRNSVASGEWWIDDGGMSTFADGDVGDMNHAVAAFESILAEYGIILDEEPDAPVLDPMSLDKEARKWLHSKGMPSKVIKQIDGVDPREWMIEHRGWIRLAGRSAELWEWNDSSLGALRSGISEAWLGDVSDDEVDPDDWETEITIEEAKTRKTFDVNLRLLMDDRMDARALRRAGAAGRPMQAKSGEFLEAAWGRKAAHERGVENPKKWSPTDIYPDYWKHHEWDPSSDYTIDLKPPEKVAALVCAMVEGHLGGILKELKIPRVYVFFVKGTKTLGRYVTGTAKLPVIVLNVNEMLKQTGTPASGWRSRPPLPTVINETLVHEYGHAYLERAGLRTDLVDHDEDLVEHFAMRATRGFHVEAKAILDEYLRRMLV